MARFILLGRDANSPAVDRLIGILEGGEVPHQIVYSHENWQKIIFERERETYPLYKFYLQEKEQLRRSPEEIWQDMNLPPKIRRQLLLERLGIEINPHLHIPREVFLKDGIAIINQLRELWHMPVGLSSALLNESPLGKAPTVQFGLELSDQETQAIISQYQQELESSIRDFRLAPGDYVILYPFVFGKPDLIVGGAIRFDTPPQVAGEKDQTNWVLELQQGVWPRGINPNAPDYIRIEHLPAREVLPGQLEPSGRAGIRREPPEPASNQSHLLTLAEIKSKQYINGILYQILRIMGITECRPVCLEFYYHSKTGRIMAVDFHIKQIAGS